MIPNNSYCKTKIAAIQMSSGAIIEDNLAEIRVLIGSASAAGAKLIVLPENFAVMAKNDQQNILNSETLGTGQIQDFIVQQTIDFDVWIIAGTIPIKIKNNKRITASCLVYNNHGERVSRYDKIHLFDVNLPHSDEAYKESDTFVAGEHVCTFNSPFGKIGLAICYDLRFPELFRKMSQQGVDIFVIPAAFTATTGSVHWQPLLCARAIENLCYVISSAQVGSHVNGRQTHGHSMIIDPWGIILEQLATGSGYVLSEIDNERTINLRKVFPVLQHRTIN